MARLLSPRRSRFGHCGEPHRHNRSKRLATSGVGPCCPASSSVEGRLVRSQPSSVELLCSCASSRVPPAALANCLPSVGNVASVESECQAPLAGGVLAGMASGACLAPRALQGLLQGPGAAKTLWSEPRPPLGVPRAGNFVAAGPKPAPHLEGHAACAGAHAGRC